MCGRFVLKSLISFIEKEFGITIFWFEPKPSYNIAPLQNIATVIHREGSNQLVELRWGLIPPWAKDPSIGNKLINARAETVMEKPSFKNAFKLRRCLILADGFYEWRKEGTLKFPVYIHLKSGKPFGFAGLHEIWAPHDGGPIRTCTIITTDSNELIKPIHNRMPVIVPKEQESLWLHPAEPHENLLPSLLKPYPSDEMEYYDVSRMVNSSKNNSPECIHPLSPI